MIHLLKKHQQGKKCLIAIDLLYSNLKSFPENYSILLDEIDSFIHPSAFKEVVKKIQSLNEYFKNIYIVTHNPEFINSFGNILSFEKENFEIFSFNNFKTFENKEKIIDSYKVDPLVLYEKLKSFITIMEGGTKLGGKVKGLYNFKKTLLGMSPIINMLFLETIVKATFDNMISLVEGMTEIVYFSNEIIPEVEGRIIIFVNGKCLMAPIKDFLISINKNVSVIFDEDNTTDALNILINNEINRDVKSFKKYSPNLEVELGVPILFKKDQKIYNILAFIS